MSEITVEEKGKDFQVTVQEGSSTTTHVVTVSDQYHEKLTQGKISKAACVKASFQFLLEHEPKEAILNRFDLPLIATYFPQFENNFSNYVITD